MADLTDAERQAYVVVTGQSTHPHTPGVQCLACRQAAINLVAAVTPTIRDEARLGVHRYLVARHEDYEAHPEAYEPTRAVRRLTPREHSEHMVWELQKHLDRYRLPDSFIGVLPDTYPKGTT